MSVKELFNKTHREVQKRNAWNACFIPNGKLKEKFQRSYIQQLLSVCAVEQGSYQHVFEAVFDGGIKTLSILFSIDCEKSISRFVSKLHHGLLDHKLPLNREALKDILDDPSEVDSFHSIQWEFLAPVFDGRYRVFEDHVIFPFMTSKGFKRQGANSNIFEITIAENHLISDGRYVEAQNRNGEKTILAIRKELPSGPAADRERQVHSQMGQLKHPNILGLYGSYMYKDHLNLILPAMNYRLSDLWADEDDDVAGELFPSDTVYFTAMEHLSDALACLHNFKDQFVGCHHDVKPANILLRGNSLILGDFGLTTFKQPLENSKRTSSRFDNYLAPECHDRHGGYGRNKVGRASDVYSLACVFTELLVFMDGGKIGVSKFKEKRAEEYIHGSLDAPFFDYTTGQPSSAVSNTLSTMRHENCQKSLMVQLLLEMLSSDPEARPVAGKVRTVIQQVCKADSTKRLQEESHESTSASKKPFKMAPQQMAVGLKGVCQIASLL